MKFSLISTCFAGLVGLLLVLATSCTLRETTQESGPNKSPEFRVRTVEAASLNGLDVLPLREPADVDLSRRNQLIAGYVNKELPLHMRVQLNAYNPGLEELSITSLDYTVLLDGRPLGNGRLTTPLTLPAGDSVRVPLTFEFNTYKFLGDDAMPALRNFALGFGDPRRQRVVVRVRPLRRGRTGQVSRVSVPVEATALAHR